MPIGVVSDLELEQERTSLEVRELKRGRGNQRQVPSSLRKLIAQTAIEDGNGAAQELADAADISPSSVSAYKHGAVSTASYNEPDQVLAPHVNGIKVKAARKAHKTLLSAIKHITEDKLEKAKPRELAGIAKDMAAVVKVMEPEEKTEDEKVKIVVFAPPLKKEEDYKVIDIKD